MDASAAHGPRNAYARAALRTRPPARNTCARSRRQSPTLTPPMRARAAPAHARARARRPPCAPMRLARLPLAGPSARRKAGCARKPVCACGRRPQMPRTQQAAADHPPCANPPTSHLLQQCRPVLCRWPCAIDTPQNPTSCKGLEHEVNRHPLRLVQHLASRALVGARLAHAGILAGPARADKTAVGRLCGAPSAAFPH